MNANVSMEPAKQEHHALPTVLRSAPHVFPDITYPVHHVLRIDANVPMEPAKQENHALPTVLRSAQCLKIVKTIK